MISPIQIYNRAPWWMQNIACSAEGLKIRRRRFGRSFHEALQESLKRRTLSGVALEEWLAARLQEHFDTARNTPHWKAQFDKAGIKFPIRDPFEALQKLPILKKSEVRSAPKSFFNPAIRNAQVAQTGGTTGASLVFQETRENEYIRWATWWRYRMEHGIEFDTWCAYFIGRSVSGDSQDKRPYHRWNVPGRQVLFDPLSLTPERASAYLRTIQKLKLPWVHGYASMIAELAQHAIRQELAPPDSLKVVTTGAENLSDKQRRDITTAFGAPVFDHYGMAETVANISQLPDGHHYVDEDLAFVEFIPVGDDFPGLYRIVGTNFHNPAFPLFRYDTEDLARFDSPPPFLATANWSRKVDSLDGRQADFIPLPDGSRGGPLSDLFQAVTTIAAAQVYQPTIDRAVFRVLRAPDYIHPRDTDALLLEARRHFGDQIQLEVEFVDSLERRPNGKLPLVISEVAN